MIVIVDRPNDQHVRVVSNHLEGKGARVFIADVHELGAGAELSFSPESADATEWRRPCGHVLRMSDVGAIWYRPGRSPDVPAALSDADEHRFAVRQWRELITGVLTSFDVPMINSFAAMSKATKPHQLALARRVGLAVPETIITSSAQRVMDFMGGDEDVVHKTIVGMPDRILATKRWDTADARLLHDLELAPTIFQRRVHGTRELRITAVGDRLFAAEFSTTFADGRLDRAVTHVPHELPVSVARGLLSLLEQLSLSIATIDMRIDTRGEYWFLEVNPGGGVFLWIEIRTGMPISEAIADLLLDAAARRRAVSR